MAQFVPPSWVGITEPGIHLDVLKEGKIVEKVAVDEKPYYLFGRNLDAVDIVAEHASCSRVHAVLLFHKVLRDRAFLMDLGSAHGTFIGKLKLEPNTPKPLEFWQEFHLGASTRMYVLNNNKNRALMPSSDKSGAGGGGAITAVRQLIDDAEIDAMTTFNTSQNVQLVKVRTDDAEHWHASRRKSSSSQPAVIKLPIVAERKRSLPSADDDEDAAGKVRFKDQDEIINPEDIDPTIGRFRDMVRVQIISKPAPQLQANKKLRSAEFATTSPLSTKFTKTMPFYMPSKHQKNSQQDEYSTGLYSNLLPILAAPNLAPTVASMNPSNSTSSSSPVRMTVEDERDDDADDEYDAEYYDDNYEEKADDKETSPIKSSFQPHLSHFAASGAATSSAHADNGSSSSSTALPSPDARKKYVKEVWPGKAPDPLPPD